MNVESFLMVPTSENLRGELLWASDDICAEIEGVWTNLVGFQNDAGCWEVQAGLESQQPLPRIFGEVSEINPWAMCCTVSKAVRGSLCWLVLSARSYTEVMSDWSDE